MCLVAQSCLTLCNPMHCSPSSSFVHGILPARILEWVAISSSRGSPRPRDQTWVSYIANRFFTIWATSEDLCPLDHVKKIVKAKRNRSFTLTGSCYVKALLHRYWINMSEVNKSGNESLDLGILHSYEHSCRQLPGKFSIFWELIAHERFMHRHGMYYCVSTKSRLGSDLGKSAYDSYIPMYYSVAQSCPALRGPMNYIARQAPLSVGFSRQVYWSGLPFPPPGDLPNSGIKPSSLASTALAGGFFSDLPFECS